MSDQNHFIDDLMQVAGGALNAFASLKDQIKEETRSFTKKMIDESEFVRRDEFEAVKAMARKAREENEALRQDIETIKKTQKTSSKGKK
jgi:BMFP domain-containing protein YqiC